MAGIKRVQLRADQALLILALSLCTQPVLAGDDFFGDKVAPIFERHCVRCHQGDGPKGGLSLTAAAAAMAGGDSGPVIVAGRPDESLLVDYISGDEPQMPKDEPPLTAEQVEAVRRWITAGANWPEGLVLADKRFEGQTWWSLGPLVRPPLPAPEPPAADWPLRTAIDRFILARLRQEGLAPSPEADRRTLIRRLTYDLHGLPPTPAEIDQFEADRSPDAYERLVDRLLASPRYGERWGRHWLDVVHYGESHGYDKDKPRLNAWPYRDYTIRSLNADKPYGRFVQEQLAGDVLFPDDPDPIVATGFIAAGPWDFVGHVELREGTTDKAIARSNDRDDMLMSTVSTFLSLTAHCARCHDHKFDPIPQTDYYRLQAVFAGVDRAERPFDPDPQVHRLRRELLHSQERLAARQRALDEKLAGITSPEIDDLSATLAALDSQLAALPKPGDGPGSPTNGYHSAIMPVSDEIKWVQVDLGQSRSIDQIRLLPARPTDFPDTPGFGFPARFLVQVSDDADFSTADTLADYTAEDLTNPGDEPLVIAADDAGIDRPPMARYVRVTATRLWKRSGDYVFALAELQVLSQGANVACGAPVTALDSIEAGRWSTRHLVDGFSSRNILEDRADAGELARRRQELEAERSQAAQRRERLVRERLDGATAAELDAVAREQSHVAQQLAALPPPQWVYAAASEFASQGSFTPAGRPRPIHLLERGNVKNPGELMSPGALSCVAGPEPDFSLEDPNDEGSRRAALALWITDPASALARRSIVNRVWHYHFGRGLVDTPNDFGRMGSLPTHPELLDWLAVEFAAGGESLKRLHRLILTSTVYRQSSQGRPDGQRLDAGNRFLWRMHRARLDAESVRDGVLAVSGKLDLTMGGPSVQQFYFKDDHSPVYDYTRFDVDDPSSYRRSVYRFIVRSVPDPFMECLDCADPSILTPKRNSTLTALQALSMLNNPFLVSQSRHFADRVQKLAGNVEEQVQAAYRLALGRPPRPEELAALSAYARRRGLANACRLLLNSNEFMFID